MYFYVKDADCGIPEEKQGADILTLCTIEYFQVEYRIGTFYLQQYYYGRSGRC